MNSVRSLGDQGLRPVRGFAHAVGSEPEGLSENLKQIFCYTCCLMNLLNLLLTLDL